MLMPPTIVLPVRLVVPVALVHAPVTKKSGLFSLLAVVFPLARTSIGNEPSCPKLVRNGVKLLQLPVGVLGKKANSPLEILSAGGGAIGDSTIRVVKSAPSIRPCVVRPG